MNLQQLRSITEISPSEWDTLWGDSYPFTRHAFLKALESSGSTTADTGWQPKHLIVRDPAKQPSLLGAIILFEKTHSYGEYVFDWSWANAYHQNGLAYYPKILSAIPFTPCTGPRMACRDDLGENEKIAVVDSLLHALDNLLEKGYSGMHMLFPQMGDTTALEAKGYLARHGCQYHWFNEGYSSFENFLQEFNSRKRKNINKERNKVKQQGYVFQRREGAQLTPADWQAFQQLYQNTYLKRSGHTGYLNLAFFTEVGAGLKEHILLVSAHQKSIDNPIMAAALYFRDANTLYGRYWGTTEEADGLHFEACYYQGIEYAIEHKLNRFDSGAQGEHKIQRGFTPVLTSSFHKVSHPGFQGAIGEFLSEEKQYNKQYCEQARESLPFKSGFNIKPDDYLLKPDR